ncbi:MAG: DNA methyltransferase, partial [Myxococcota bacterium]
MEAQRYKRLLKALQKQEKAIAKEMVAWGRKNGKARVTQLHEEAETGGSFDDFLRVAAGRSAVRFLLRGVYVRVLEDLGVLREPRLRGQRSYRAFRELAPGLGYRAYLAWIYRDLAVDFPALFEPGRDELPMLSEALCRMVWDLWHEHDGDGQLLYDWSDSDGFDSRFLGDLYEALDDDVRKRYALLQTPDFVEEYILDQTLGRPEAFDSGESGTGRVALHVFDPARLRALGDVFRVLDPTCGSGHFLVGAFSRMLEYWERQGLEKWKAVVEACSNVWGCDINPYAVDIARFRLLLEVVSWTGEISLSKLGALDFNIQVMDSLVPWEGGAHHTDDFFEAENRLSRYASTDERARNTAFVEGRFHAVVGNPPYVQPKDRGKREDYALFFPRSCYKEYALVAPFIERFWMLAVPDGFCGLIVADSFLTRSFGRPVCVEFLANTDLQAVVDCSLVT